MMIEFFKSLFSSKTKEKLEEKTKPDINDMVKMTEDKGTLAHKGDKGIIKYMIYSEALFDDSQYEITYMIKPILEEFNADVLGHVHASRDDFEVIEKDVDPLEYDCHIPI